MASFEPIPSETEQVAKVVLDAAYAVHSALGPGLLESAYEACLAHELESRSTRNEVQVAVPLRYKGIKLDTGFRIDMLVENAVIVELKAVEALLPIHEAQLITYLKLTGLRLGLLINFNVHHLKQGVKRLVL
jgi:GxxExxY protein